MMIILIDLDGPLADFEGKFLEVWRKNFPDEYSRPLKDRRTFYIRDDYPEHLREKVDEVYYSQDFILNLPIVPGSKEAIGEMLSLGHEVKICSAPLSIYTNCVLEKYQWVEKHFGFEFTKKIILSKDKTLITADYLIDDKPEPEIEGCIKPKWEHILYDAPYNRNIKGKKRIRWSNWKEVLGI